MTRFYADRDYYDTDRDDWGVGPFPFEYYEPPTRPRILRSAFAPGTVAGSSTATGHELGDDASLSASSPARGLSSDGSRHE